MPSLDTVVLLLLMVLILLVMLMVLMTKVMVMILLAISRTVLVIDRLLCPHCRGLEILLILII